MNTGDAKFIKQINRRILIEEIIKNTSLSRSDLARITGLNKATVSAQINDLINDHIVIEKHEGTSVTTGRKPIILEINANSGYSVGIDIDSNYLNVVFTDLNGKTIHKLELDVENYRFDHVISQITDKVTPLIDKLNQQYKPIGLVGAGVAIHGIVNNDNEIIFTPKQKWSNLNVQKQLEDIFKTKVYVDNNANLSAYAEQVYVEHISDLFCITLYSGIGLGILNGNNIYRGYEGFAGEIGHMIVESDGLLCSCGNRGCWELYASERSLMEKLSTNFPSLSFPKDFDRLKYDSDFEIILDEYSNYLAIGLNNVINLFNPEKIVLNGSIINNNSGFVLDIQEKLKSKMNNYREIKVSKLGKDACSLGGAALALKNFLVLG